MQGTLKTSSILSKCPKCHTNSLLKTPHGRIMSEKFGQMVHIANEYSFDCLCCDYKSKIIRENTKMGNYLSLPWYKRIFNI